MSLRKWKFWNSNNNRICWIAASAMTMNLERVLMANDKRLYVPPRMEVLFLMRAACLLDCSNDPCEDNNKGIFDGIGMTPFDNLKRG